MNRPWMFWEVTVPLGAPVVISLFAVAVSATGPKPQPVSIEAAIDLAPWTLCFFSLTLIASSMRRIWPKMSEHPAVSISMLLLVLPIAIYTGQLVVWNQDPAFTVGAPHYVVSGLLAALSIWRCHASSQV